MMKRIFLILCLVGFSFQGIGKEKVRITTDEWPPYTSAELKYNGVVARIAKEIFIIEDFEVEISVLPTGRAKELALRGIWDMSMVWSPTPDRKKDFHFSFYPVRRICKNM